MADLTKFEFGEYSSSNTDIAFSVDNNYNEPTSEAETRKQLSYPLYELKTYINQIRPVLTSNVSNSAVKIGIDGSGHVKYRTTTTGSWSDATVTADGISCPNLSGVDLNDITYQYMGYVSGITAHTPTEVDSGTLISVCSTGGTVGWQLFKPGGKQTIYSRKRSASTWGSWGLVSDVILPGDSISFSSGVSITGGAYVDSGATKIRLSIPLGKTINATSVSCTALYINIANTNGYMTSALTNLVGETGYTVTASINSYVNGIDITIDKTSAFTTYPNSTAVTQYSGATYRLTGITLSFS